MFDFWLEYLIAAVAFLTVTIAGYFHTRQNKLERELKDLQGDTYRKVEVIEHIDVRINPVSQQVMEVHKDVREIKSILMNQEK